uniref:Uncharacterized protein n=1 Tax=Romanomermis culicivorax TaxID=13658 RepID=A0A915IP39_ROMCU
MIHGDIQAHFSVLNVPSVDEWNKPPVKESQVANPITVANVLNNLQLMSRIHPEDYGINVKQLANRLRYLNRQWSVDQYEAEDETTRILKLAEAHEQCHEISKNFWRPGSRLKHPPIVQRAAPTLIPQEEKPEPHFLLHEQEREIDVVEKPAHKSSRRKLIRLLKTLLRITSLSPDSSRVGEIKSADVQERESVASKPKLIDHRKKETTRARSRKIVGFREPTTILRNPKTRQENFSNFTLIENMTTIREQERPTEYTGKPYGVAINYQPEFVVNKSCQMEENQRHKSGREGRRAIKLQRTTITDLLDDSGFEESRSNENGVINTYEIKYRFTSKMSQQGLKFESLKV